MRLTKILLAYQNLKAVASLEEELTREGYFVISAENCEEAYAKFNFYLPHLLLIDSELPPSGGNDFCRKLREESDAPIIVLSSKNEDAFEKMMAFRLGADDYVSVPFLASEVVYRVKAILHRLEQSGTSFDDVKQLVVDNMVIDKQKRKVLKENQEITLTAKEFDLLWLLASKPGYVFTREQLLYYLWDTEYAEDMRNITVLICRLRSKIEPDPEQPFYVQTVRGVGYKFNESPNQQQFKTVIFKNLIHK